MQSPASHERRLAWITACGLVLILAWDASGADFGIMMHLGNRDGFPLRESWWLSRLLHEGLRDASVLAFVALAVAAWKPFGFLRRHALRERLEMLAGVSISLLAIGLLKQASLTSCPWDLLEFGGALPYVPHWMPYQADGGPGHCFPSGHASAGYAYLAVAVPGLLAASDDARRRGRRVLAAALIVGSLCGATQVLRGAHYPGHVMWTALICWLVALANHRLCSRMAR